MVQKECMTKRTKPAVPLQPGQPIRQRQALVPDFAWDVATKLYPPALLAPPKYDGPYAQFSDFTMSHILPGYR